MGYFLIVPLALIGGVFTWVKLDILIYLSLMVVLNSFADKHHGLFTPLTNFLHTIHIRMKLALY